MDEVDQLADALWMSVYNTVRNIDTEEHPSWLELSLEQQETFKRSYVDLLEGRIRKEDATTT